MGTSRKVPTRLVAVKIKLKSAILELLQAASVNWKTQEVAACQVLSPFCEALIIARISLLQYKGRKLQLQILDGCLSNLCNNLIHFLRDFLSNPDVLPETDFSLRPVLEPHTQCIVNHDEETSSRGDNRELPTHSKEDTVTFSNSTGCSVLDMVYFPKVEYLTLFGDSFILKRLRAKLQKTRSRDCE